MPKHLLVLADGTEIGSGQVGDNAVRSVSYTQTVADDTDLAPGAACACKLEIELWVQPGHALHITSGTEMTCYRLDAAGGREKIGVFRAVKPTKASRNTYKVYAYDAVSRLDGIQSTWLRSIQGQFPMSLWAFAQAVAARCGVTIANTALPANGSYQVQAFYADDLTGRQLLAWVAQAAGCFLRANADGALEFGWYKDRRDIVIGPGEGAAASTLLADSTGALLQDAEEYYLLAAAAADADGVTPYYDGTLSYEDYTCATIDKVQIRQSSDDVGVVFPADEAGTNALTIEGNLLLTTSTDAALRPVAQALYAQMQSVEYTPCTVRIPAAQAAALGLGAGQIVRVQDARGRVFDTWIMTATWGANGVTLESTGNASRDGSAATNQQIYKNLTGKMLEISASVDGLKIANRDLQGNLASLELTVEGIETNVQKQLDDMTDYVDEKTGEIKDQAVSEAVSSAMQQVDESLTFYPTKVEMQSAIEQSASEINLTVSQKLTGYSTTSQMQQYVNGQTSGILDDAKDYTDGQLKLYPTTIEMNSAIEQSAASIRLSVNETLTMYPSNTEMEDYVDGQLRDYVTQVQMESAIEQSADNINLSVTQRLTSYSTTSQMQSYVQGQTSDTLDDAKDYTDGQVATRPTTTTVQNMIDIGLEGITLSASTNGTTSTITLKSGSTTITSAQIKFTGLVTFTDLYTSGKTQINADNITTGSVTTRITSATQGIGPGAGATELEGGVLTVKVSHSLVAPNTPIFQMTPIYSNGMYYEMLRFIGDTPHENQITSLYPGDNNFNITSENNGSQMGLVISMKNVTTWCPVVIHGDTTVEKFHGRVVEWRYVDSIGTYVLCGPRTDA